MVAHFAVDVCPYVCACRPTKPIADLPPGAHPIDLEVMLQDGVPGGEGEPRIAQQPPIRVELLHHVVALPAEGLRDGPPRRGLERPRQGRHGKGAGEGGGGAAGDPSTGNRLDFVANPQVWFLGPPSAGTGDAIK